MKSYSTAIAASEQARLHIGPVSVAIATMRAEHPDRQALEDLREAIYGQIRIGLSLLDWLGDQTRNVRREVA